MDAEDPTLQRLEDQIHRYDDKRVESQRRFAISPAPARGTVGLRMCCDRSGQLALARAFRSDLTPVNTRMLPRAVSRWDSAAEELADLQANCDGP
jgi:hypothetical protein